MTEPIRVSPEEARRKNREDSALLVCAYEDEKRFSQMRLKGAISLKEFRSQLLSLAKDREIIFYCA